MSVVYEGTGTFINPQTGSFDDINIELFINVQKQGTFWFTGELEIDNGEVTMLDTVIAGVGRLPQDQRSLIVTMAGQGLEIEGVFTQWTDGPSPHAFRDGAAKHFSGNLRLINASVDLPPGMAVLELPFAFTE